MKLSEKQQVFTENIGKLIAFAYEKEIKLTFGEAHRTQSQGLLNFFGFIVERDGNSIKLSKSRKLSNTLSKSRKLSNTLNSLHLNRLAVDFNFFINGKLTYDKSKLIALGEYWESLNPNNKWGGNFKSFLDTPHFEMS